MDLGWVRLEEADFPTGVSHFENALNASAGEEERGLALFGLGVAHSARNQNEQAEDAFLRSLEAMESAFGTNDVRLASVLYSLAAINQNRGDFGEAERYHRRTLQVQQATLDPDDPALAQTMANLASAIRLQGRQDESLVLLERADSVLSAWPNPDPVQLAVLRSNMGEALLGLGRLDEAEPLLFAALQVFTDYLGDSDAFTAGTRWALGDMAKERGELEEALRLYDTAFPILAETYEAGGSLLLVDSLTRVHRAVLEEVRESDPQSFDRDMRISAILAPTLAEARDIMTLLDAGQDFASVAEARSAGAGTGAGGDLGYFLPGELLPALDSVALELRIGERSDIVETEAGFFIIEKTDESWRRR